MATSSTRLKLTKPVAADTVDVKVHLSDNYDKIDAAISTTPCTSTTRPSVPFQGQAIFETDTSKVYVWSGTAWVQVNYTLPAAPAFTDYTNAKHTHLNDAGGGTAGRLIQIPFHLSGSQSATGLKKPKFIANQAMTIKSARAIADAGSGFTFSVYVNGAAPTGMATSSAVGTAVVQDDFTDFDIAVGDRVQINVDAVGTSVSDVSITLDAVSK